jgi:putative N6-adenine-specific DNA methylase
LALANHPTVRIAVRFVDDVATISLDTSATPLHRRGYRLDGAKAPLREDIAFAVLQAAGFRKGMALLDPFCGSGTIAIEAACIAAGLPPGRLRPAPLQGFAFADAAEWQKLLAQLLHSIKEAGNRRYN